MCTGNLFLELMDNRGKGGQQSIQFYGSTGTQREHPQNAKLRLGDKACIVVNPETENYNRSGKVKLYPPLASANVVHVSPQESFLVQTTAFEWKDLDNCKINIFKLKSTELCTLLDFKKFPI